MPVFYVEVARGFVEQQYFRLLAEGPRERDFLEFSAAQVADMAVAHFPEAHFLDGFLRNGAIGAGGAVAHVRHSPEQDRVVDGHFRGAAFLGHEGHQARPLPRRHFRGVAAADVYRTLCWGQYAGDAFEQRAFPGAVVAEHGRAFSALHREPDALQNRPPAPVSKSEVFNADHGLLPPADNRYKNAGAPSSEVMAPIGSDAGAATVRAATSLRSIRAAPVIAEAGTSGA